MAEDSFIDSVLLGLQEAIQPLTDALASPEEFRTFLSEFGWTLDPAADISNIETAFGSIGNKLNTLADASPTDLLGLIPSLLKGIKDLKDTAATGLYPFNQPEFWKTADGVSPDQSFPIQVFDYLLITYLQEHVAGLYGILLFIGIFSEDEMSEIPLTDTTVPPRSKYLRRSVNWANLPNFIKDPPASILESYSWNSDTPFNHKKFLNNLAGLASFMLALSKSDPISPELLALYFDKDSENTPTDLDRLVFAPAITPENEDIFALPIKFTIAAMPIPEEGETSGDPVGFALIPVIGGNGSIEFAFTKNTTLGISGDFSVIPVQVEFRPNSIQLSQISLTSLAEQTIIDTSATLQSELPKDSPWILFGSPSSSRLELQKGHIGFKIKGPVSDIEYTLEAAADQAHIVIDFSSSDGFLQKSVSKDVTKIDVPIGFLWSSKNGFAFSSSSGVFEASIPVHLTILNTLTVNVITISLNSSDNDGATLTLSASISLTIGPLAAIVENVGINVTFTDKPGEGNLGDNEVGFSFKPPNGVGLSIDAGVIKGAGYLFIDTDRGEYAGALELTFQGFLSLKAIGLIATKMPDGSEGFSLLIIITAEFTIQLGMGFVFLGAGGLLGLHRTAKLTPLAEGVRSGSTANLLFPTNVVENAPQIISDIRIFFPIEENHFLIGPMVKLGYGTPPLISISLGIIIEIKTDEGGNLERIAILGVLKCILPEEKAAILVLQVNFIGAIDLTKKTGFFFASIFESRVLAITIEGEMGVLVAWGEDSNFIVSVGGFHPRFNPPPLPFPVPKRLSLSILNKSWGKIRVEGYFAVTTNTVQFGAKIEVKFGIDDFKIDGHLAFDVLFQFSPFYFIVEISGKVSLKVFGAGLFSVRLKLSLEGPTPWRAKGYGKIKILFFSFKARFDKKWGESKNTTLPPIEVMPILLEEIDNDQNWQAIIPESNTILVSLRELPEQTDEIPRPFILHPVGKIKISQRAVPCKIKIDKVGNQKPSDANNFKLENLSDYLAWGDDAKESFAPAQFFEMKSSKKLSEPATRKYVSGSYIEAKNGEIKSHTIAVRHVRYELTTIDTAYKRFTKKFFTGMQVLFGVFLNNNAAAKSTLSYRAKKESQPFVDKINVMDGNYTVAFSMNNKAYNDKSTGFENQWEAEAFVSDTIKKNPQMADEIYVIPSSEVNMAA